MIKAADPKVWATALSIVMGATIAFLSSPHWPLAALITVVVGVLTYQFLQVRECLGKHEECTKALHARDLSIAVLYLLAEQSRGRRKMPALEQFLGKEKGDRLIEEIRLMMSEPHTEETRA